MQYKSTTKKLFDIINIGCLFILSLSIVIPFIYIASISFSDYEAIVTEKVSIYPIGVNINAYIAIMNNSSFIRSVLNSIFITVCNTILTILIAVTTGYVLSNKYMKLKKTLMTYVLIPLYFSGGMIPYFLVVNKVGLTDKYGALIFPVIVNSFYIIIFRNTIAQLPRDLMESAEIDGAGEAVILFRIVIPVIIPMMTAFIIFNAVWNWNEWFNTLLFVRDRNKWPLQFALRNILANKIRQEEIYALAGMSGKSDAIHTESYKMTALMITTVPIAVIYPFLQKYFIHGIIVGAVKG